MTESRTEKTIKHIHEGTADVSITFHYDGWDPTIDREDVEKLQRVQLALRNGDLAAAAKEAKVYKLLPISPKSAANWSPRARRKTSPPKSAATPASSSRSCSGGGRGKGRRRRSRSSG